MSREIASTYEVTELVPGERVVMRTAEGPFPMQTAYTWQPAPRGTPMTLHNTGAPSGFPKVARSVLEAAMRRATTKDLAALKRLLEGRV